MNRISIKLTKGSTLFKPGTTELLKEGDVLEVVESTFWRRRIADGSVEIFNEVFAKEAISNKNKSKNNSDKENT